MLLAISVTLGGQTDDGQTGQFALSLVQPPPTKEVAVNTKEPKAARTAYKGCSFLRPLLHIGR